MRRTDLPESIRRQLDQDRRRVCRDVGRVFDALVDNGHSPDEMVAEVTELLDRHMVVALARDSDQREAA